MALITCTECGKEFSDKAPACPNCGCPTSEVIECLHDKIKEQEKNICPYCGEFTNAKDDYCDNCGLRLTTYTNNGSSLQKSIDSPKNKPYTICPGCGYHNSLGVFNCQNCGHKYSINEYATSTVLLDIPENTLQCPTCNSHHIEISILTETAKTIGKSETRKKSIAARAANTTGRTTMNIATGGLWGILTPKRSKYAEIKTETTKISHGKYAVCQNCGFSWKVK